MGLCIQRAGRRGTTIKAACGLTIALLALGMARPLASAQSPQGDAAPAKEKVESPKDGAAPAKQAAPKLGLLLNEPKALQGYTLLSPMNSTKTYLIDMQGRVVNQWKSDYSPAMCAWLLENGNLLRPATLGPGQGFGALPGAGGRIQEFTWEGNLVWDFKFQNDKYQPHHDICRLPNGNVIMIVSDKKTYGLGINGLYVNLKGRERDGTVEPGEEKEAVLKQLAAQLESFTDADGRPVIRKVYRADQVYSGGATALSPDLIVGYYRGYRASWETCLGELHEEILRPNTEAWSADHCADALEVPGVLFSNRALGAVSPSLVDVAPSVLAEYGLEVPSSMQGKNIFST